MLTDNIKVSHLSTNLVTCTSILWNVTPLLCGVSDIVSTKLFHSYIHRYIHPIVECISVCVMWSQPLTWKILKAKTCSFVNYVNRWDTSMSHINWWMWNVNWPKHNLLPTWFTFGKGTLWKWWFTAIKFANSALNEKHVQNTLQVITAGQTFHNLSNWE